MSKESNINVALQPCVLGDRGKAIYFRGTGKQRPTFEGNRDNIGEHDFFRFLGNWETSQLIFYGTPTPPPPITGRASIIIINCDLRQSRNVDTHIESDRSLDKGRDLWSGYSLESFLDKMVVRSIHRPSMDRMFKHDLDNGLIWSSKKWPRQGSKLALVR